MHCILGQFGVENIQTATINKSDSNTFATGDTNGDVHLWRIDSQSCIQSFSVNKEVTTLEFGTFVSQKESATNNSNCSQRLIAAGTLGGVIILHDLRQNKVTRQYCGHRSEVRKISFHGKDFMASCSTDCNVKLWDIRQKQSAMTYKGHSSAINCVLFSPDGRWLASADAKGITKLWDVVQGKVIHEFHDQSSVNDILFHPEELVLATGSTNKLVRFWDLETWEHIGRTQKVTTPIKKILFPVLPDFKAKIFQTKEQIPDATPYHACLAATKDSLRLWKWEPRPVACIESFETHV